MGSPAIAPPHPCSSVSQRSWEKLWSGGKTDTAYCQEKYADAEVLPLMLFPLFNHKLQMGNQVK